MDRIPINKYPYTDFHEINLDWVIERIQEMYTIIDQKIADAVDPINQQITTINSNLAALQDNFSTLSIQVTTNTTNIGYIRENINTIESDISNINTFINTISEDISSIFSSISTINDTLTTHTAEIADIYNKIAEIDPDTGLIVDATNFNVEQRTASVLDPVYDFHLEGSLGAEQFVLYPDLIPGTQSGYYPRVTMVYDSNVMLHLPSELTPAGQGVALPTIIRGTYATNVDKNGDIYAGDPLEYSINGEVFTVEGYDADAIILICIDCLHRRDDTEYENVYINNGLEVVHGVPYTDVSDDYSSFAGPISHRNPLPYGLEAYVYFFDIDGALLGSRELPRDDNPASIPHGTYSIWYGIGTSAQHEAWTNTSFHIMRDTMAGSYYVSNSHYVTEHKVKFEYNDSQGGAVTNQIATKVDGIYGLGPQMTIDMFTGDVSIQGTVLPSQKFNIYNGFKQLIPDKQYDVTLIRGARYLDADLKYNKVMAIINGLDANNTRY